MKIWHSWKQFLIVEGVLVILIVASSVWEFSILKILSSIGYAAFSALISGFFFLNIVLFVCFKIIDKINEKAAMMPIKDHKDSAFQNIVFNLFFPILIVIVFFLFIFLLTLGGLR